MLRRLRRKAVPHDDACCVHRASIVDIKIHDVVVLGLVRVSRDEYCDVGEAGYFKVRGQHMTTEVDTLPERVERCLAAIVELSKPLPMGSVQAFVEAKYGRCEKCDTALEFEKAHNSPEINDVSKAGTYCPECCVVVEEFENEEPRG